MRQRLHVLGVAIMGSPNAGVESKRYWASLIAAVFTLTIALDAGLVIPILALLPSSFVFAPSGFAIFSALQDAFGKTFGSTLRFGVLVTLAVASTPF